MNLHLVIASPALKEAMEHHLNRHNISCKKGDTVDVVFFDHIPDVVTLTKIHDTHLSASILMGVRPEEVVPSVPFPVHTIQKPFHIKQFIKLVGTLKSAPLIKIQTLKLYPQQRKIVSADQRAIMLTEKEVNLLVCLHGHRGASLTKEYLLETVWGYQGDTLTHTLETHVYKLNQKLKALQVDNVIRMVDMGYQLNV